MPEQISRRSSIKICESPLHRGSQHGSPAFRKKKFNLKQHKISDGSQMSSGEEVGCSNEIVVVAPPPRSKRSNGLTMVKSSPQIILKEPSPSLVMVKNNNINTAVVVSKRPPTKPPKPPNVMTTSRIAPNLANSGKPIAAKTTPPKNPSTSVSTIVRTSKKLLKTNGAGDEISEHIYESVDIRPLAVRRHNDLKNTDLRMSTEVQCWPWPKQSSLPPNAPIPRKTSSTSLAKTIQSSIRSVSLGRGSEQPPPSQSSFNTSGSRTLLQRFAGLRRSFNSREKVYNRPVETQTTSTITRRPDDPDWVFFRGFGAKKSEDIEPYAVCHGPSLTVSNTFETPSAPPRRKRPQRLPAAASTNQQQDKDKPLLPLRRSLSFTDAHYIAQAVYEGDTKLIEELYPDFPRSEPIYAVVDKTKKVQRPLSQVAVVADILLPVHQEVSRECSSSARSTSSATSSSSNVRRHAQVVPNNTSNGLTTLSNSAGMSRKKKDKEEEQIINNHVTTNPDVDTVTFNNSVMFVRQSDHNHSSPTSRTMTGATSAVQLPDVVNESSAEVEVVNNSPRQVIRVGNPTTEDNWNTNGVVIECSKPSVWQSNVHPFAHRTHQRYARHQSNKSSNVNNVSITSGKDTGVTLMNHESLEDSFEKILRSADHSIYQAESILTNLRQRSQTLPAHATPPTTAKTLSSEDSDSLGSDIDTNIRKLERTQVKINAALEAFRHVRQVKDTDIEDSAKGLPTPSLKRPLMVMKHSRTAPAKMQLFPDKDPLTRRHSFNNNNSHSTSDSSASTNNSTKWYEADVEESDAAAQAAKDGSWSDSESGFMHPPIKSRLRGLLGTFGRSKKQRGQVGRGGRRPTHPPLAPSISDPIPILQPDSTSVSDYARRIEILAHDLSNGSAMEPSRRSGSPASSGYYTPPSVGAGDQATTSKTSTESSQRNSVSSDSDEPSDSEEHQSAPSLSSNSTSTVGDINRNKTKAFYIANELMTSERVFVDVLRLLNVEFRDYVQKARRESKSGLLPDTDYSRLFNNLPELQTLNEDLLQDFENRIANWSTLPKIADVIVTKGPFLKLYTTYIREFSAVNYHFDDCCQKFPKFAKLVKDFEKRECCRNLKLKHFMLKPVQRLPQYKLLLEDYLRHLPHDTIDFDDTTNALRIVSDAAEHANNTIRQGDKFRKMLQLQSRLGDYFELIRPGRDLIKEGELQKISRKEVGPRYFILLSDCLLYTTYSGSWSGSDTTSLRVSYQIPLSTLTVRLPSSNVNNVDGDMATEIQLTSPVRSFSVRATSIRERNAWLDSLNTAIEDHNNRKATFFNNDQRLECKMGMAPPIWVPDRRVTMCQKCAIEFTVLVRRHHCRACGQVICSSCSSNKAPLRYLEFDSARVCDPCYEALEKELGNVETLRSRFKKRENVRPGRYVPQRLKVSANGEGSQMSGYLRKKQKNNAKWKRMWFVLKDRVLYAYKAPDDSVASDTFPILGFVLETLSEKNIELYEGESGGLVFQLAHPGSETLIFCADNDNICEKWMAAINEAVKLDNPNNQVNNV